MRSKLLSEAHEAPQQIALHLKRQEAAYVQLVSQLKQQKINQWLTVARGSSDHAASFMAYLCMMKLGIVATSLPMSIATLHQAKFDASSYLTLAFSQSGQSPDLSMTLQHMSNLGAQTLAFVNDVNSPLAVTADHTIDLLAGTEISVAATKSFIAQLVAGLSLVTHWSEDQQLLNGLASLPEALDSALEIDWTSACTRFEDCEQMFVVSRGLGMSAALEAALKLKEISYIHAEGYPAAEMKHGPIALIDEKMPVVFLCNNQSAYEKIVSNIQEVKARKGRVIGIVEEGDEIITNLSEFAIAIPSTEEPFSPLLASIPLQLLAYHIAVLRGCNVDQPRNLAKSVTVE